MKSQRGEIRNRIWSPVLVIGLHETNRLTPRSARFYLENRTEIDSQSIFQAGKRDSLIDLVNYPVGTQAWSAIN